MVLNVGICLIDGWSVLYNEKIEANDSKKIEEMFKKILIKVKGNLGCVCIYMNRNYKNEIRQKIIEIGKQYGFLKIQIIDGCTLQYLGYSYQMKCKPSIGDIIWILSDFCSVWEKNKTNVKILWCSTITSFSTKEDLLNIKGSLEIDRNPDFIIYDKAYSPKLKSKTVKMAFPHCKLLVCKNRMLAAKAALIKARIMKDDKIVSKYDVEMHLCTGIFLKVNKKEVLFYHRSETLPITKSVYVPINDDDKVIHIVAGGSFGTQSFNIFNKEIEVTGEMLIVGGIFLTFKIDENQICSMKYIIKTENGIADLNAFYFERSQSKMIYYIPPMPFIQNENVDVVGIDLGTSRCCAAVNRRNGIETVALDITGERMLPSYVSFIEECGRCGQMVIDKFQRDAQSSIFDAKRIIGRSYQEVKIDACWPFQVVNSNNKPVINIHVEKSVISKTPEEVAAVLLKHIKQKLEEFQGKELNDAVITVPATFTKEQKFATITGAKLAGWKNVYLFPEPVAASIAYFIDRPIPNNFTMLLFDFGGGTLDVCILNITNSILRIISQTGDSYLGGRDFDNTLFNYFSSLLNKQYNINVNSSDKLKYRLMKKCITIKHLLSVEKEALLDVNDFNEDIVDTPVITRSEFETLTTELCKKMKNVINCSLSSVKYTTTDIHKVLLAGGSSRMPMVKNLVHNMFPKAEHCCEKNPDEIVAIGAAYAFYLNYSLQERLQQKESVEDMNDKKESIHSLETNVHTDKQKRKSSFLRFENFRPFPLLH